MSKPKRTASQSEDVAPEPSETPESERVDAEDASEAQPTPEQDLAEARDKWLRARAELDNVRKRAQAEIDQARLYGAASLLTSLLGVLDTLQRALQAVPEDADVGLVQGLQLTEQQFLTTLEAHGVVPVEAHPGQAFDPTLHRALLEEPRADLEPGSIVSEAVRGYRLHDRLLREAQVVVACRTRDDESPTDVSDADL